jgi:hypothetical protein
MNSRYNTGSYSKDALLELVAFLIGSAMSILIIWILAFLMFDINHSKYTKSHEYYIKNGIIEHSATCNKCKE